MVPFLQHRHILETTLRIFLYLPVKMVVRRGNGEAI